MSWQDELRDLDAELAAGHISADDYRLRRDALLSSAVSQDADSDKDSDGNTGQDGENTQIVSGDQERTQALGRHGTRPDDADRTQSVPGVPPQNLLGGLPPRPAPPGYHQEWPDDVESLPWAGPSLPPLASQSTPDWVRQGPEVFDETRRSRRGPVTAIVVVLAAVVVVGIWWNSTRTEPAAPPAGDPPPTTTSSAPPRPLDGVNGEIDETVSGGVTAAEAAENHQFSPEEATILDECRVEKGDVQVLYRATWYTVVHVFPCADTSAQPDTVEKLTAQQKTYGFTAIAAPGGLPGMIIANAEDVPDAPVGARVFYASGDNVIRVEVRGHTRRDVDDGLAEVLAASTEHFPAT